MDLENGTIVFVIIIAIGVILSVVQWWDRRHGYDRFGGDR
jgi:hypothetical protein